MRADECLRAGDLDGALSALQDEVRQKPDDCKLRMFLFQILSLVGEWDRAMTQLNVAAEMDADALLLAQVCRPALNCEALRSEIFGGRRSPVVFGQPPEWVVWLTQVLPLLAEGKHKAAADLRDQAFEAAPAVGGMIDDKPFEWIADADSRLGPVLEAIIQGEYYWVPFVHIKQITTDKPASLRDAVWMPSHFTWTNGGEAFGLIPTRYAGSEKSEDSLVRLARKTDWANLGSDFMAGLGQRMLATNEGEYSLMEVRRIAFNAQA